MKILTVAIPTYNMSGYLRKCIDSILVKEVLDDLDVVIVNDGSKDDSAAIAQEYADRFPGTVRLIDKENGGHGSAVNAGLDAAAGFYFKVLDADDWFDRDSLIFLVKKLRERFDRNENTDVVLTNYVYEKVNDNSQKVMKYSNGLPQDVEFTDKMLDRLSFYQFLSIHTLTYRTQILRDCGLRLQHHTYYVDNEYSYIPIPYIHSYIYYDIDLYRYLIGRPDQSVTLEACLRQSAHQDRVFKRLALYYDLEHMDLPEYKRKLMFKELNKLIMIYGSMMATSKSKELVNKKFEMFDWLKANAPYVYKNTCNKISIKLIESRNPIAVRANAAIYYIMRKWFKFQ